jgi:hypothetical protein
MVNHPNALLAEAMQNQTILDADAACVSASFWIRQVQDPYGHA